MLAVVIDPGRAFGTGAHPTTQLCLELLQELEPGSFLDVGCGSGVLSVAAALLGHAPVLAVDIEAPSIAATRENAARNGVELEARARRRSTTAYPATTSAVANISVEAVRALPGRVDAELAGHVRATSSRNGSTCRGMRTSTGATHDGWAADLHRRASWISL